MHGEVLQLGLIGAGIGRSLAPRLHGLLGRLHGLTVRYALLDAQEVPGYDPLATARRCTAEGFAGVNVTHPFKRALFPHVRVDDPRIARIGSVNTVRLQDGGWPATNTDFTGFLRAYRHRFGAAAPGEVLMLGAGGVGRSVALALAELGARHLYLSDTDPQAAAALGGEVAAATGCAVTALPPEEAARRAGGVTGLVNCTPVGMHNHPGNPFAHAVLPRHGWAFDAVYTPAATPFLQAAQAAGLEPLTGFELFLFQGLDAFRFFTGLDTPQEAVRATAEGWLRGQP